MRNTISIVIVALAFVMTQCPDKKDMKQGLAGKVLWYEGNMMPKIKTSENDELERGRPVQRQILVYKPITAQDCEGEGVLYDAVNGELVASDSSNREGVFFIPLPEGKYSVLIKEGDQYFASVMDGKGHLNPVEIKKDEISRMKIEINYKAAY
ncbi:MAG TPA: hypothetical protein DDY13_11125 [Cytophagales bacterium]|jgi:hypothetical protein|nr:hypothetical protein [Cytophagales bacterium]